MAATDSTHVDLDDYPDSAYAAELRRGLNRLRFEPALEDEFLNRQLRRDRFRVRIWWYTGILLVPVFAMLRTYALPPWGVETWFRIALELLCIYAVSITYSPRYEERYRRQRALLIPLGGCSVVMLSTIAVLNDDHARLIAIAATIMCVFLISGAVFRIALATCVLMLVTYIVLTIDSDASLHFKSTSIVWVAIVAVVGVAFGWDKERLQRLNFLEAGLINELVERDSLTQIKNRRAYDRHLERIWQQAIRDRRPVAVMMIDVDHFKLYNDGYGHQAGDEVLRKVARIIDGFARRPLDLAARYGGEEFSVILYDMNAEAALKVAEQLRQAIAALNIPHRSSSTGATLTASIGMALVSPISGRSPRALVQMADEALYMAKQAGRNRVQVSGHDYESTQTGVFRTPQRS